MSRGPAAPSRISKPRHGDRTGSPWAQRGRSPGREAGKRFSQGTVRKALDDLAAQTLVRPGGGRGGQGPEERPSSRAAFGGPTRSLFPLSSASFGPRGGGATGRGSAKGPRGAAVEPDARLPPPCMAGARGRRPARPSSSPPGALGGCGSTGLAADPGPSPAPPGSIERIVVPQALFPRPRRAGSPAKELRKRTKPGGPRPGARAFFFIPSTNLLPAELRASPSAARAENPRPLEGRFGRPARRGWPPERGALPSPSDRRPRLLEIDRLALDLEGRPVRMAPVALCPTEHLATTRPETFGVTARLRPGRLPAPLPGVTRPFPLKILTLSVHPRGRRGTPPWPGARCRGALGPGDALPARARHGFLELPALRRPAAEFVPAFGRPRTAAGARSPFSQFGSFIINRRFFF